MADIAAVPLTPASPPRGALARAERFVWLTARVLEQRLFAHHFRDGAPGPVETALDAYRNDDGGYGHGLRGPAGLLRTRHARWGCWTPWGAATRAARRTCAVT